MPLPPTSAAPRRSPSQRAWDALRLAFWRAAASGWLPASWFNRGLPAEPQRAARTGRLHIEVVSHCWRYAHLLAYQLSSVVHFPPHEVEVTMTVFYAEEDEATAQLLARFAAIAVPQLRWRWWPLPKEQLFRRAIGRNLAALATSADWVWFTDCDLMFREGCLDTLGVVLRGRRDALVYPRVERVTELLAEDDPRLRPHTGLVDIDDRHFVVREPGRATGPLQITHGDVARALGYCAPIAYYQQPAERWCKAHEDRAHRWLLETQGTPIELPGVYRIRHVFKGRYTAGSTLSRLRGWLRQRMG
jgi:hypothetical protein